MYWMLIGTLCLLTNAADPNSLSCVRVASDIKFIDYTTCNAYSYQVVEEFREDLEKYPGQNIKFFCVPYQPINLKGTQV